MNNNFALEDMATQLDIIKNKLWVTLEDLREECFNSRNVLPDSVLKSGMYIRAEARVLILDDYMGELENAISQLNSIVEGGNNDETDK